MKKITITKQQAGKRIDKFLAEEFFLYSRGEIIKKIKDGEVLINMKNIKPGYVLGDGDIIEFKNFSKEKNNKLIANDKIQIQILFQDENIIVVNKQAGIQVHPSHNEKINTVVNVLINYFPEIINVHDDSAGANLRPGIVHRLDKDTSGVMIIARNTKSFKELKKCFEERHIEKKYIAITEGTFEEEEGVIEKPLARSASYRKQVIARGNTKTTIREAQTFYKVCKKYGKYTLVEVCPKTGRMHQIRIHLASIGHPVVGDSIYAGKKTGEEQIKAKRQLLHAKELKFTLFGKKYAFIAPIPDDFREFLADIDPALN